MSAGASNLSPEQKAKVEQLIREARAAIKLGDKSAARARLQEAVTIDQYSEQGWYWLASVVDTDEERKTCLGNVVVINPNNEKAKQLLDRLSGNLNIGLMDSEPELEGAGGPLQAPNMLQNRRVLIAGGLVVVILLVTVVLASLVGRGGGQPTPTFAEVSGPTPASVAQGTSETTATTTPVESGATMQATQASPGSDISLPPTWTPTPAEILSNQRTTPLPPPPATLSVTGRLTAVSGSLISSRRNDLPFLPVFILDPLGKNMRQVSGSEAGDYAVLTPDGTRLVFVRYNAGTTAWSIRLMNANGTQATELSRLWNNTPPLAEMRHPSFSRNGDTMVFSAISLTENDARQNLYIVQSRAISLLTSGSTDTGETLPTVASSPTARPAPATVIEGTPQRTATPAPLAQLRRLTSKESGINSTPAISPDGRQIVYASDARPLGTESVDLYLLAVAGGTASKLTKDDTALLESEPEFSPDGKRVAYQAAAQGSKLNDIYVINTDGSKLIQLTEGYDNIRPHWSPDGKFLAFSSNRTGRYEIHLINVETKETFQVTFLEGKADVICTGWSIK